MLKQSLEGKAYAYEVTNIELLEDHKELAISNSAKSNNPNGVELLDSTDGERPGLSSSYQSNSNVRSNVSDVFVSGAKLLNNLEKSYEKDKNLHNESKLADESTDLHREPDDTDDVWTDESLGLQERIKTGDVRDNSKINPDALMHRFYGVANINGVDYRVMTLMKEENKAKRGNDIHSYEVQKIEVLDEETPNTSNGVGTLNSELEGYPLAKVIKDVGKTMDKGKN